MIIDPFVISDFRGGMRMNDDPTKLAANEYYFLSNGRSRTGSLIPVKLPLRDSSIPSGYIQFLRGYGSILVIMVDGRVYYKDYATMSNFLESVAFPPMSTSLPVFTEIVPASTLNLKRTSSGNSAQDSVNWGNPVTGSPQALMVSNGFDVNRILLSNGDARLCKGLNEWSLDDPEYVPRMKQLFYHPGNAVLYGVSPSGTEIYRSVAGQPFNFVIAITNEGLPLGDNFYSEEAQRLSHKFTFNEITCLKGLNYKSDTLEEDPPFFAGTEVGSFAIFPKYDITQYDESTFRTVELFPLGPSNQNSFTEMFGDYGFISSRGLHSFNAVSQFRNEGKTSPFYLAVEPLFKVGNTSIVQDNVCVGSYDNYTLFALNSRFGRGILVYDPVDQKFVAFDIYPGVGQIVQFAEIIVGTTRRLFCYDVANNMYELFAGNTAEMLCYPKEWKTDHMKAEMRMHSMSVAVSNIREGGTLTLSEYFDTKKNQIITESLAVNTPGNSIPMTPPYGTITTDSIRQINKRFERSKLGWKIGAEVKLNCDAEILQIQVTADVTKSENANQEQANVYAGQSR